MNKTLLLIICDFLLLNLLALTRWDRMDEHPAGSTRQTAAVIERMGTAPAGDEDLVETLRLSLEEERASRDALTSDLEAAQARLSETSLTLAEREQLAQELRQGLAARERQAQELSERVAATQGELQAAQQRIQLASQEAGQMRSQSQQLQQELAARQREAAELAARAEQLERDRQAAQQEIQSLTIQTRVAEQERVALRETVDGLRGQVASERAERERLYEHTGKLAEGVTQLAGQSAELRQEIRSTVPVNANVLFSEFLENRVRASFEGSRQGPRGPTPRAGTTQSVLVTDGAEVFAIFHVENTPLSLREAGADWLTLRGSLASENFIMPVPSLRFLSVDPRIVAVPVPPQTASQLGAKVYPTALEPFRWPEAVLINTAGGYYGETEFRLDPATPGYVRMRSRIFSRLFGEFSPSTGDLVFSKTGELLGIMINREYCALIDTFLPAGRLPFGEDVRAERSSETLNAMRARVSRLPRALQ
jgi:predicted  nucleic acid-binding Zn-ribbon protein